jgi:hypothetical protein
MLKSHFNELPLDRDLAALYEKMNDPAGDWSRFNAVDARQARSLLRMQIRQADMAFYEYERGMLSEVRLNSALRPLLSSIHKPIVRSFWEEVGPNQVPEFRDYMNRRIVESARSASRGALSDTP